MIVAHSLFSRRVDQVPVKFSLKSTSEQTVQRAKMMPFKIKGDVRQRAAETETKIF
jgi:hypothetical protein